MQPKKRVYLRPFDWQKLLGTILILAIAMGGTLFLIQSNRTAKSAFVPVQDLPPYHLITDKDFLITTIVSSDLPAGFFHASQPVAGFYTRQPLKAGQVLERESLVISSDPTLTSGTVPVSISAGAAVVYNGQLSSGTMTKIWLIDANRGKTNVIVDKALVIDVLKVENSSEDIPASYVIVLAIPENKQAEILEAAANNLLRLTISQ